jgi:hypothetical protein
MRKELIEKEEKGIATVPKKRMRENEREEKVKRVYSGVEVSWEKGAVYTEIMIKEMFCKFGEIVGVGFDREKSWVVFGSAMAAVR